MSNPSYLSNSGYAFTPLDVQNHYIITDSIKAASDIHLNWINSDAAERLNCQAIYSSMYLLMLYIGRTSQRDRV